MYPIVDTTQDSDVSSQPVPIDSGSTPDPEESAMNTELISLSETQIDRRAYIAKKAFERRLARHRIMTRLSATGALFNAASNYRR